MKESSGGQICRPFYSVCSSWMVILSVLTSELLLSGKSFSDDKKEGWNPLAGLQPLLFLCLLEKTLVTWAKVHILLLLTNNFELLVQELAEIYKRRWAIETLYKQLKQNFPLHFFYGESVNAIQIQTWVVLIAHLLCTVLSRMIKRHVSFSQIVTMLRLTLMYYTNFIAFMEDPQKDECAIWAERAKSPPSEPSLFD